MKDQYLKKNAKPNKNLRVLLKKHSGRDSSGQISVRHQGKRQKRYFRIIDFLRDKRDIEGTIIQIEKDPNRNSFIALVKYNDGEMRYILSPVGLKPGDKIISGNNVDIKIGNALPLKNMPLSTMVHNIEIFPGKGGQMARSAGTGATVIAKEDLYVQLKLQSGEIRRFMNDCYATVGQVGNIGHKDEIVGSAGRNILRGIRPTVRGTAQDPRSHPHGGGENRSGEGMHPKTPWGKSARGTKTRHKNIWSKKFIIKRK